MKYLVIILFSLISLGCSLNESIDNPTKTALTPSYTTNITGLLTIIGNEPFTDLSLNNQIILPRNLSNDLVYLNVKVTGIFYSKIICSADCKYTNKINYMTNVSITINF